MLESRNNSPVFEIDHLSFSYLSLYLACSYCAYIDIYVLDIFCAILIYMLGLFVYSYLYSTKRAIVTP